MKITALEESANFATLDTEKLFSKLKSHELSHKSRPNHDASFTSKALITSARVGGHDANPTNITVSAVITSSDEQYESIPDDEVALLLSKIRDLHKFCKERRRSPTGSYVCSDNIHFIIDCPKWKKLDSSNKYNCTNRKNSSNKGDDKKKHRFRGKKKKKKFQKIMSRVCAALGNFDFSSDDSSSSEEDEKLKCKKGDFIGLCLMGKS
jgi:hypothetical protein